MSGVNVNEVVQIPLSAVVYRADLYPRVKADPLTVQKYAENLGVLPPIELNQHNELIDGWHRWTAHKKVEAETIPAVVTQTSSDVELLEFAIERNAAHGLQLSQEDKRNMARRIYTATPLEAQGDKKKRLAQILSVETRTVQNWLSRIDKDNKEQRDCKVRDLWFACCTEQEIAEAIGMPRTTVMQILTENESLRFPSKPGDLDEIEDAKKRAEALAERNKALASHETDFVLPIYNIWKQQVKTNGSSHFGNSDVRWVDNLLYLYTKPFDVVVDPFAGGGSTIDICKTRFRRYFVSDRLPIVERASEIRLHDLVDGLPPVPRWKDVSLVYLDPPYWAQAAGEYSKDAEDLANMNLEDFNKALAGTINAFASKLKSSARTEPAYIALIIQPTQWRAPERQFTDHVGDMLRAVKLPVDMRFSVPYESQQCTPQMVEWAKANRKCLVLTREIVVWRVS